jgi:hypothetical protein
MHKREVQIGNSGAFPFHFLPRPQSAAARGKARLQAPARRAVPRPLPETPAVTSASHAACARAILKIESLHKC